MAKQSKARHENADTLRLPDMSDQAFQELSDFIYHTCGVHMPPVKKVLLTSRLAKRLRKLGMSRFEDYVSHLKSNPGDKNEITLLINAITTNKTDFYREPKHFDYLVKYTLPALVQKKSKTADKQIRIWSAGCSSGEEPYTIAMMVHRFLSAYPGFSYSVLATDISQRVMDTAQKAIYPEHLLAPLPKDLKYKYMMRGTGNQKGNCRLVPEIRNHVEIRPLNLNSPDGFQNIPVMDIIFCRNVIIYFDRETQVTLFNRFYDQLEDHGHLFIGHSETLHGINDRFVPLTVSAYRK